MPNSRRNPRLLRNLQVFDAISRHGSLRGAAEELGVSASAVSHQLRDLTRAVGEQLIARDGRGIVLTEAGLNLAARIATALNDLDGAVDALVGERRPTLRIAVCTAFGPGWLIPRMASMQAELPDLDVELRLYAHDPEQTEAVADCIVTARPVQLGFLAVDLFDERLVAVAGHSFRPGDRLPLITTNTDPAKSGKEWSGVCEAHPHDVSGMTDGKWLRCTHYTLAMAMAQEGLGLALVPDFLAGQALADKRLNRVLPGSWLSG